MPELAAVYRLCRTGRAQQLQTTLQTSAPKLQPYADKLLLLSSEYGNAAVVALLLDTFTFEMSRTGAEAIRRAVSIDRAAQLDVCRLLVRHGAELQDVFRYRNLYAKAKFVDQDLPVDCADYFKLVQACDQRKFARDVTDALFDQPTVRDALRHGTLSQLLDGDVISTQSVSRYASASSLSR